MSHLAPNSGWTVLPAASASASAGPSFMASASLAAALSASSGATASARPDRRWKKLPQEAYDIMIDYYNRVSTHPKKDERTALAERIRRIPGCEDYNEAKVNNYFANRRTADKARPGQRAGPTSSGDILYPSLLRHPNILPLVEACLKDIPEPSEEIAEIMATKIGHRVKFLDILTYAKLRREQGGILPVPPPTTVPSVSTGPGPLARPTYPSPGSLRYAQQPPVPNPLHQHPPGAQILHPALRLPPFERSTPPLVRSQLPTPASSTSPEPRSPVAASKWGKVEVEEDDDEDVKDELDSDDDEEMEGPEKLPEVPLDVRMHALAADLQESLSRLVPGESRAAPPKTFADLASWLKQEEPTSSAVLRGIQQGAYVPLGLTTPAPSPSMSR